jgi:hypothetical protein
MWVASSLIQYRSSAGGTLATICSHLYRDADLSPTITGVFASVSTCIVPSIPIPEQYGSLVTILSWKQNEDAPLIGSHGVKMFKRSFLLLYPLH